MEDDFNNQYSHSPIINIKNRYACEYFKIKINRRIELPRGYDLCCPLFIISNNDSLSKLSYEINNVTISYDIKILNKLYNITTIENNYVKYNISHQKIIYDILPVIYYNSHCLVCDTYDKSKFDGIMYGYGIYLDTDERNELKNMLINSYDPKINSPDNNKLAKLIYRYSIFEIVKGYCNINFNYSCIDISLNCITNGIFIDTNNIVLTSIAILNDNKLVKRINPNHILKVNKMYYLPITDTNELFRGEYIDLSEYNLQLYIESNENIKIVNLYCLAHNNIIYGYYAYKQKNYNHNWINLHYKNIMIDIAPTIEI